MHTQLQRNKTFLKNPIKKPCHHSCSRPPLRKGSYFGGCSSLPRQQWQYHQLVKKTGLHSTAVRQEHQQWGEKDDAWVRGRRDLVPSQWWSSSFPSQAQGNGAMPKGVQVCEQVTCRFTSYCLSGVSKTKN